MSDPNSTGGRGHGGLPTRKYRITFLPANLTCEVDPAKLPYGRHGRMGSILEISAALAGRGLEIEHSCGGVCACATCHVIVREGLDSCSSPEDDELDQLDEAPGHEMNSRLACQCIPDGTRDIVVEIPAWNRNATKESES
ncbi:MAG: 2Fe-2S iron-sulfur cluster-binding protein [bacterium]|nr:2Fe-2S iron-sulfur cluster-binding protein [bacterium]